MPLALRGSIVVYQGVDATAYAADTDTQEVGKVGGLCHGVTGKERVVEKQKDVCGSKAKDEGAEDSCGQEQSPRLLVLVGNRGRAEASDDGYVTDGGEDQRHEEEDGGEGGEIVRVVGFQQLLAEHVVAGGDVELRHEGGLLLQEQGRHPAMATAQTARQMKAARPTVRQESDWMGYTTARKRSTLMAVMSMMEAYMFP